MRGSSRLAAGGTAVNRSFFANSTRGGAVEISHVSNRTFSGGQREPTPPHESELMIGDEPAVANLAGSSQDSEGQENAELDSHF